jgi:hypothetical protein
MNICVFVCECNYHAFNQDELILANLILIIQDGENIACVVDLLLDVVTFKFHID